MAIQKSASAKTPNTPLTADVDLDVAWGRTISKVQGITNWNLNESTRLTVDDVLANLKPSKRDGQSESHEQAKKVFRRTLQCIQTFGNIAAQSASMVFGPSNQCFNAVNFVIIAAQSHSEAIENISILMERISVFLERLRIYLEDASAEIKLEHSLRLPVYRVLDHFLVVMGNVHKITSSLRGKVKLSFKLTLLGEDSGIKDALAKLETRVADVTHAEITTIVKNLSEAAKSIRSVDKKLDGIAETVEKTAASASHLQAAEDRRSEVDQEQKETAALRKALGIDDKREPWEDRQGELRRERIAGTGKWLLDLRFPSFSRWSDPKETSLSLLSVRAEQGFGKSFLSSIVVDDLIEKHRNNPRVCIAYYYFSAERDSSESRDSGKDSVNRALKSIVWQLAQTNRDAGREFRKLAIKVCESNVDLSKTEKLWSLFVTDHEKAFSATFYVILDGLNDPETEPGHPLSQILNRLTLPAHQQPLLRTRVFVTGRSSGLSDLMRELEQKPPEINLAPSENLDENAMNHDDILLYAEERLSDISFYRGTLEDDDRVLKERVKTTLARGVRGDFFTLRSKLDEIAKARDVDKVDEILRRADEDRAQVVERQIKQLNETLTTDEIEEVNELLKFVIAGFRFPSISSLEAALRLQGKKKRLLGPLLQRIQERYSDLFLIEEEADTATNDSLVVHLRSEEIENYLRRNEEQGLQTGKDTSRRSGDSEFHEAEIALVERVIKTHMRYVFGEEGQDIYSKYRFNEFFDSKRGPTAAQIHFHSARAHVDIARGCLIALCDNYDEPEYGVLHDYAFIFFSVHLETQIEKSPAGDALLAWVDTLAKYDIGRKLVRLLTEKTFIDAWLEKWILDIDFWTYETANVDTVQTWLRDPEIQRALQDMPSEKRWVASLTEEGVLSIKVLSKVVASVAESWLTGDNIGWPQAFGFMFGYFCQLRGRPLIPYADASVQEVMDVVEWAKVELDVDAEEARWDFCTGTILQYCPHWKAALTKYREALDKKPDYWKAKQRIAVTLGLKGDDRKAITTMNELIEREQSRLDVEVEYTREYWGKTADYDIHGDMTNRSRESPDSMLPAIVTLNLRLDDYIAAEEVSKKIVARIMRQESIDPSSRFDVKQLMSIYLKQRKHSDIVQLLEELTLKVDFEEGNWLVQVLYSFHSEDAFHNILLDVGKNSAYSARLFEIYQAAIDGALSADSVVSKDVKISLPLRLRTMLARLKWHLATSMDDRHLAIAEWEEILHSVPDEENINFTNMIWTRRFAARLVGPALVTAALEKSPGNLDVEVAEQYLTRLEALQTIDHATGRQPVSDIRVPLARLVFLTKQPERAKNVIRSYVGVAVQLLEESQGDNMEACDRLVNAFLILEDDINALAAFTLFNRKPLSPIPLATPVSATSSNRPFEKETERVNGFDATPTTTGITTNGIEHQNPISKAKTSPSTNETVEPVNTQEPEELEAGVNTGATTLEDQSSGHTSRPTYPRIHLRYLSIRTLKYYQLPWEHDEYDSDYIIIKRDIDELDTRSLFDHTQKIRQDKIRAAKEDLQRSEEVKAADNGEAAIETASKPPDEDDQAQAGASPEPEQQEPQPRVTTPATPASKRSLPTLERLDTTVSSKSSPGTGSESPSPYPPLDPFKAGQCSSIACEHEWEFPSDMYACRDCFKIICPPCYKEFKNGTSTHVNCHETHTHLHVPPVDAQKFIDRPRDIVWVAGEDVTLEKWLNDIKSDWQLEARSVKARERWFNAVRRLTQLRAISAKEDAYDAVPTDYKYYVDSSAGR